MIMAMTQDAVAIGVFSDVKQARHAIDELRRAGFSDEEIGFLSRVEATGTGGDTEGNAVTGAISGGVIGGVLGAAVSLLIPGLGPALAGGILAATFGGVAVGATAGGIIGALTGLGVSDRDASFYQRELEAGRTIVTVKSADGAAQAAAILQQNGAYNARSEQAIFNAPPTLRPRANEEIDPNDLQIPE
jgi:hypothetical protein